MDKWFAAGMGNADKVHFTDKGYQMQGMLFYNALAAGYDEHTKGRKMQKEMVKKENSFPTILQNIFKVDPKDPMIFSNYSFWIFFLVLLAGYVFIYNKFKARTIYLMLFSFFFYYKMFFIFILVAIFYLDIS